MLTDRKVFRTCAKGMTSSVAFVSLDPFSEIRYIFLKCQVFKISSEFSP